MPAAHIDPDEVERFARDLAKISDQAASQLRQLQLMLNRLPEAWRDQHFQAFSDEMRLALNDFDKFRIKVEDFLPWLGKKIILARAYLDG